MDLPKCRTCGERHRAGPCPAFEKSGGAECSPQRAVKQSAKRVGSNSPSPLKPVGVAPNPPDAIKRKRAPNGTFDRKSYQRDYMRRHRAEKGV